MSNSTPIVNKIRIIPRQDDFLDRLVGDKGDIFYNSATGSLRVYNGNTQGGAEIAKADLTNVNGATILAKLTITNDDISWIPYAELADLPLASENHGMFAHVHSTGKAYYAHAGSWIPLANESDIPIVPTDISQLTDTTNLLSSGDWPDITNKPSYLSDTSIGFTQGVAVNEFTNDDTLADASATAVPTEFAVKTYVDTAISSGGVSNAFVTAISDDGSFNVGSAGELTIVGGTNISTEVLTDSEQLTINLDSFGIDFLSDVDTTSSPPSTGQVLKWDGAKWAPGVDATSGGAGLDADTLDGFDSTYFLDYNNFTNTPSVLTLTSLSVGIELAASGDGAISYDNTTGVFRYTPPDLSSYLTSVAFSDLTSTPTTLSGYGITDAALSSSIPTDLTDLGISDGTSGQVLTTDGAGNFTFTTVSSGGSGATNFLELSDTPGTFGTAGQVVVVNGAGTGLEFANDQTGDVNQNAFSNVAVAGQTTVTADNATDTLTLAAGSNVTLTTSGNTVTINSTASGGSSNFSTLTDAGTASLTIDKVYEPAIVMLRVNNVGTSAYTFDSHYTGNNPTIYAISGTTIAFDLDNISGHPFEIQDNTLTPFNTGLVHVDSSGTVSTGSSAQGKSSGTLYWRIPETEGGTFAYQCQSHASMVGNITVKRLSTI